MALVRFGGISTKPHPRMPFACFGCVALRGSAAQHNPNDMRSSQARVTSWNRSSEARFTAHA